ncbi:MAG: AraC family transcriptional regulator [Proteobacteria bacterium]|nr:AraC family transcriptional regulator [Pseudomonadota bacterium]
MNQICSNENYMVCDINHNRYGEAFNVKGRFDCQDFDFNQLESETGYASMRAVRLRPGLYMLITDRINHESFTYAYEIKHSYLEISYHLKGSGLFHINSEHLPPGQAKVLKGSNMITFLPQTWGTCHMTESEQYLTVCIFIDPELFMEFVDQDVDLLPDSIKLLFNKQERAPFFQGYSINCQENLLLHQLLSCPFKGSAGRLFTESKVIELIARFVEKLFDRQRKPGAGKPRNPEDIEKLYQARELLVADLSRAPTLSELSRKTGLNEFKLKSGFKSEFNATIHGYFQFARMQKARDLIEQGKHNVSQVAWEMGYVNVSHFIGAYRKIFGINPGSLLKEMNRLSADF